MKKSVIIFFLLASNVLFSKWECLNNGIPDTRPVYSLAVSGSNIVAGMDSGKIFVSTNNGDLWEARYVGNPDSLPYRVKALATDGHRIVASVYNNQTRYGRIYYSTNMGNDWIRSRDYSGHFIHQWVFDVRAIKMDGQNVVAGVWYGWGVFVSTNYGVSWQQKVSGPIDNTDILYIEALDLKDRNIWAGTPGYGIFKSTDLGETWDTTGLGYTNIVSSLSVSGDILLAAIPSPPGTYISTDGGNNWGVKENGLPNVGELISTLIYKNYMFVGDRFAGVFLSTNMGDSWVDLDEYTYGWGNVPGGVSALASNEEYIFTGGAWGNISHGGVSAGVCRTRLSDLMGVKEDEQGNDISIFPNPASDYIYINSSIIDEAVGVWQYQIYDILGNSVQEGMIESDKINISQLSAGFYTVRFFNGVKQLVEKLMKE